MSEKSNPMQAIAAMVRETQDANRDVLDTLPNKANTPAQRALQEKHGTPREFAEACINAIGEISALEANVAIRKYRDEWNSC